jgi:hypothetical protein
MVADSEDDSRAVELILELIARLDNEPAQAAEIQRQAAQIMERFTAARSRPFSVVMLGNPTRGKSLFMQDLLAQGTLLGGAASASNAAGSFDSIGEIITGVDTDAAISAASDITSDPRSTAVLEKVSSALRKAGATHLNSGVLLIIVLVLITLGVSFAQTELPADAQSIITDDIAYLGLALAIVAYFKDRKP